MFVYELRLGNWVIDIRNLKNPVEHQIDLDDLAMFKNFGPHLLPFRGLNITEEWLLKFGFKKTLSIYFWINIKDVRVEVKEVKDGFVLLDDGGAWNSVVFKHVHQLQNLYFALTNTELVYEP